MLQLKKSIRLENLKLPFRQALQAAASIGADAIEINARTELRPGELSRTGVRHLKKMLADLNLKVSSVNFVSRRGYNVAERLEERIDATKAAMEMAWSLGAKVVSNHIGAIAQDVNDPGRATMIQALSDLANHSHRAGAWLAAKTGSEPGERLKELMDQLPPGAIGIDFDPGSLVINGFSPSDAIRILGDRVLNFRARDAVPNLASGNGVEVQLGRGSVDLAELLSCLEEHRYTGYITIDRDAESDVVLEHRQSIEYLQNVFG